jgi:hypothetical protein
VATVGHRTHVDGVPLTDPGAAARGAGTGSSAHET